MTKIIETKLSEINPDQTNANRHTERGEGMIRHSINKYGFAEAGTLDKDNNVIGGNLRTEASADLGMDDAIIVDVDGTKPVYLRRNDLSLTDPNDNRARELAYALNRVAQVSIDFDPSQVLADLNADIDLSGLFREDELERILGTVVDDPNGEWGGMPEFEQEDKTAFRSIYVHFKDQEAVNQFAELTGQKITEKTRFLWYPEIEIETYADKRYIDES